MPGLYTVHVIMPAQPKPRRATTKSSTVARPHGLACLVSCRLLVGFEAGSAAAEAGASAAAWAGQRL